MDTQLAQQMLNVFHQSCADVQRELESAAWELRRPSTIYRPGLSIDGNQWCALYGENLQDGVAGFGDSPELACLDFDKAWATKLTAKKPEQWVCQECCGLTVPGYDLCSTCDNHRFERTGEVSTIVEMSEFNPMLADEEVSK